MLGNGGANPQNSRTAASVAILVVAAVCVALVSHDSGYLKEETSPDGHISTTPELRLVQMPMILASDSDIRRAIAAKEHKATKAKNQAHERRHKADKVAAHAARHNRQFRMPSSMQKMVEARNHKYEMQQRQRQMAAALENPSSDDDVQLFQVLEFTDDTERRAAKKESGMEELLQVDAAVQNFSDDIAKELSDFTSSSHAVASNLLDDEEAAADSAKTNVAKLQTSLSKPHPKKKVAAKKKKTVKKTKTKSRDDDMDDGGPMARFVAFQRARQAMQNALGTANKEAKQSTMDEDDNLQLFQVHN